MIVTEDAEITKVYESNLTSSLVKVEVALSREERKYLAQKIEGFYPSIDFSIRSKLAQVGINGYIERKDLLNTYKEIKKEGKAPEELKLKIRLKTNGISLYPEKGIKIGRVFAYHPQEAVGEDELEEIISHWKPKDGIRLSPKEWPSELRNKRVALELNTSYYFEVKMPNPLSPVSMKEILNNPQRYIECREITLENLVEWFDEKIRDEIIEKCRKDDDYRTKLEKFYLLRNFSDFIVLETKTNVIIPEGYCGLITKKVSYEGNQFHSNSRIVDDRLKFSGKIKAEIHGDMPGYWLERKPEIYLAIYPLEDVPKRDKKDLRYFASYCPWGDKCEAVAEIFME